jgi:hypothetical protein
MQTKSLNPLGERVRFIPPIFIVLLWSFNLFFSPPDSVCKYDLPAFSIPVAVEIDGAPTEAAWSKCHNLTNFSLPWDTREAPETSFRAFLDEDHMYFFFRAHEETYLESKDTDEGSVAKGDRVEIFFALDSELSDYYCLEITPNGKILDYKAAYYRKFCSEWDMRGLRLASQASRTDYSIEAAIPLTSLRELGFPKPTAGDSIRVGLFRADFVQKPTGVEQNWISWCNPHLDQPDFHVPGAFGRFEVFAVD